MTNDQLNWTYRFENKSDQIDRPDWMEIFETNYLGNPVEVSVRVGTHPIMKQPFDAMWLIIYSDSSKKDFVGFTTEAGLAFTTQAGLANRTCFLKPLKGGGSIPMDPEERPNLEEFIAKYKPIFESQRDLRQTYEHYL